jgi:hypothetical protein
MPFSNGFMLTGTDRGSLRARMECAYSHIYSDGIPLRTGEYDGGFGEAICQVKSRTGGRIQGHEKLAGYVVDSERISELKLPAVTVGKWRRCFAAHGLEGLRVPRARECLVKTTLSAMQGATRVCQQPNQQGRWSVRTLAAELGLHASTVHGRLVAAKLPPHRSRTFTFSPDPDFEAKLLDIVGLSSCGTSPA